MFGKKQQQILELQNRVRELENILCPFNQHDFVETGRIYDGGDPIYSREVQLEQFTTLFLKTLYLLFPLFLSPFKLFH